MLALRLKTYKNSKIQFYSEFPEPQHLLGLRLMAKKGLDAYVRRMKDEG